MMPGELRTALEQGIQYLRLPQNSNELIEFEGVYSDYYMMNDDDNFVCLCHKSCGYLLKANPKRHLEKIVCLFYYDMTAKI